MIKIIFVLLMALVSNLAFSKAVCDGQTNAELENCAHANFDATDKELNRSYSELLKRMPASDKPNFVATQRAWVSYKEKYCQSAYDATSPGEEAGVDKWSCFASVTETRTKEIHYLDSSVGMGDFRKALAVMASVYEGGDTNKVVSKLINQTPDGKNPDWRKYVDLNCKMTAAKLQEEHDACVARLNFYKNW
ncbi:lysozyme inhibitor LprI family protein [Paraburkholderia bryophila]|uniref:lysozyme inhibitor LprI family protein n=1 Tax=Burkholderiaceae TaxID=119060 RepID=UPI0009E0675B|nr:lysozyme inhibitor LprI family protein [Burkholderia sp. 9120]